jgi:hypothetical protein
VALQELLVITTSCNQQQQIVTDGYDVITTSVALASQTDQM